MILLENDNQDYQIFAIAKFDIINTEDLSQLLIEKGIKKFRKLRSIKSNFHEFFYWKEVPIEGAIDQIKILDGITINNESELVLFEVSNRKTL